MIELVLKLGIAAGVTVVAYVLVQKVLAPLVGYVVEKKRATPDRPKADRVTALEINLTSLSTQVTQLETRLGVKTAEISTQVTQLEGRLGVKNAELQTLVDERSIATDNKLDIVLAELRDIREAQAEQHRNLDVRLARVEENVKHLEKTRGR